MGKQYKILPHVSAHKLLPTVFYTLQLGIMYYIESISISGTI